MNEKSSAASPGHRDRDSHESHDTTPSQFDSIQPADLSTAARASRELKRTTSNVLSQIASRITTRTWPEPAPPPDGGLKAWTQVVLAFFVLVSTWGYANSFGAFQTYYTGMLPQSPSTISWIGGIQVYLSLTIGSVSGRLLDAGYFLPTFVTGIVIQLLGVFLMSISTKYWQLFLTQGVLSGIGAGIYFTPAVSLVSTYFDKHRGLAIGVASTGNSLGGLVYPLIVQRLIPMVGFAWTTRVIGFLNLGILSLAVAFMRPRLPPRKSGPLIDLSAFKEPIYSTFVFGSFFMNWSTYYSFYYVASFGTQALGMPYTSAANLVIIINIVGLPFRILTPMLADRFGALNVIAPAAAAMAITAFSWVAVNSVTGVYVWTVFYGSTAACFQCLFPSTISRITPKLDTIGTRLGMGFAVIAISSLSGPSVGGAIQAESGGSFRNAQIWSALSVTAGTVLFVVVRIQRGGLSLMARV